MSDMIPGVNKIGGNSQRSEPNGAKGSERGGAPPLHSGGPRKFLGPKTPLDWLKIGLNSAIKNTLISLRTPMKS